MNFTDLGTNKISNHIEEYFLKAILLNQIDDVRRVVDHVKHGFMFLNKIIVFKGLKQAIEEKSVAIVQLLVSIAGVEINWLDSDSSLLYRAICTGNEDIVSCLIQRGADVNLPLKYNKTLLHCVVNRQWILDSIVFPDEIDKEEYIDAYTAKFTEFLILCGGDVYMYDDEGNMPLHIAVAQQNVPAVKSILMFDVNVNIMMSNNGTPLHIAVQQKNLDLIKILLEARASIWIGDYFNGETPFHLAVRNKSQSIAEYFLDNVDNISHQINCFNARGETVLHFAAHFGFIKIIKLLIEKGAKVNLTNSFGKTPLMYALKNVTRASHKAWLDPKKGIDEEENVSKTCQLCNVCVSLIGNTPEDLFEYLDFENRNNFCIINAILANRKKYFINEKILNPLLNLWMHQTNKFHLTKMLLEFGADVNYKSSIGYTLLHSYIRAADSISNAVEIISTLLDFGANVNSLNYKRKTPLHFALKWIGNEQKLIAIVSLLLKNGADVFISSKTGETPLDLVKMRASWSVFSKNLVYDHTLLCLAAKFPDTIHSELLDPHSKLILSDILLENECKTGDYILYLSEVDLMKTKQIAGITLYDIFTASLETLVKYFNSDELELTLIDPPHDIFDGCDSYASIIKTKCKRAIKLKEKMKVLEYGKTFLVLVACSFSIPSGPLIHCSDRIFKHLSYNDFRNLGIIVKQ